MQREKQTISGKLLEVDFYPVFNDGRRLPGRAPKTRRSTPEQLRYNKQQASKKLIRLVNANFGEDDFFLHPTYIPENAPQDEEQARKDIVNYLRRVRRKRDKYLANKKEELSQLQKALDILEHNEIIKKQILEIKKEIKILSQPFKYIYVIERITYQRGERKGFDNYHFHLFLSGGIPAKELEKMWNKGIRCNCRNYQPETFGPSAAAAYMAKDLYHGRKLGASQNLKKPLEKKKTGHVSRRTVSQMATARIDNADYWERRYKGYKFIKCESLYNEYNGYWYVNVIMYRTKEKVPLWQNEDIILY